MRRIPLGGLFLAACFGVEFAEVCPAPLLGWAIAFGLFAMAVVVWKQTALVLSATLLFFGFWHSFRTASDRGYQLAKMPDLANRSHQIDLEAEADSKPFHWGNQIKQVDCNSDWRGRLSDELSGPGRIGRPARSLR